MMPDLKPAFMLLYAYLRNKLDAWSWGRCRFLTTETTTSSSCTCNKCVICARKMAAIDIKVDKVGHQSHNAVLYNILH
jgi:hypothetical protein